MAVRRVLISANEASPEVAALPEARFGLPITEVLLDRGGRVAAASAE
jgi:hypothetical protein